MQREAQLSRLLTGLVVLGLAAAGSARADLLLTFGNATVTDSSLVAAPIGSVLSGTLRYDPAWPDSDPNPNLGVYYGAIRELSLTVGALSLSFDAQTVAFDFPVNAIVVADAAAGVGTDSMVFDLESLQLRLVLTFTDPAGTALSSDQLPTTVAGFNGFAGPNAITVVIADGRGNQLVVAQPHTAMTLEDVPEPASILLAGLGLTFIVAKSRGRSLTGSRE